MFLTYQKVQSISFSLPRNYHTFASGTGGLSCEQGSVRNHGLLRIKVEVMVKTKRSVLVKVTGLRSNWAIREKMILDKNDRSFEAEQSIDQNWTVFTKIIFKLLPIWTS